MSILWVLSRHDQSINQSIYLVTRQVIINSNSYNLTENKFKVIGETQQRPNVPLVRATWGY